eukprot:jgi/Psemu1/315857/fgenesh1_kg.2476_\
MKSLALQWTNVFEEIREDRVNGNVAFTRMVVGRKCKFSRVVNGGGGLIEAVSPYGNGKFESL